MVKEILRSIQNSKYNILSTTRGLKGYSVGKKRFPNTREGEIKAIKYASSNTKKNTIHYLY